MRIIRLFRETGKPVNTVNMCARTPATHSLVVRHFNRVGVLASILDLLREEGINVEEMENTIFAGAKAACCTLQLDTPPSDAIVRAFLAKTTRSCKSHSNRASLTLIHLHLHQVTTRVGRVVR